MRPNTECPCRKRIIPPRGNRTAGNRDKPEPDHGYTVEEGIHKPTAQARGSTTLRTMTISSVKSYLGKDTTATMERSVTRSLYSGCSR